MLQRCANVGPFRAPTRRKVVEPLFKTCSAILAVKGSETTYHLFCHDYLLTTVTWSWVRIGVKNLAGSVVKMTNICGPWLWTWRLVNPGTQIEIYSTDRYTQDAYMASQSLLYGKKTNQSWYDNEIASFGWLQPDRKAFNLYEMDILIYTID